ncbi:MAG: transglutaminase domain-containing protein [Fimbriiglobus sp.]
MRNLFLLFGLLAVSAAGFAADPPGVIVIRPQVPGSKPAPTHEPQLHGPAVAHVDPDRPGLLVVRPQLPGQKPLQPVLRQQPEPPLQPAVASKPVLPAKPAAPEQPEDGRAVLETWDAVTIRGLHVGYFHVLVREFERDGKKFLYSVKTQRMWVARFGTRVEQWGEDSSMETTDGAVLANRARQGIGRDQMLSLEGRITGNTMRLKVEGQVKDEKEVPWPDGVLGVAKEATLFADRKPKPGDTFSYLSYEGRIGRAVKFQVTVQALETAALGAGGKPRKLLRSEVEMEPIGEFRLPPATVWCDAETFEPLKMESDVPSLGGKMLVIRTDKMTATRPVGKVPDLFDVQSLPLNRPILGVHDTVLSVTYKITAPKNVPAEKVFPADDRQSLANLDPVGRTAELTVTRSDVPPPAVTPKPGAECLDPSFFVDWDTDAVKRAAKQATADLLPTATDFDKAKAVERWVHRTMKPEDFSQAMATCSNVARTLTGDCTEYAMLAAGMCRAVGVPSRTALGVVYATDRGGKPFLAYHMWFEVYANGRWIGLDGTLGRGRVGPGHLKITTADWHEEKSLAPLLPLLAVLQAGPKAEVIRVVETK